ncbi:hypothetical protein HOD08_00640 [bacterium]|nr:hypothetical protein [bacterium]
MKKLFALLVIALFLNSTCFTGRHYKNIFGLTAIEFIKFTVKQAVQASRNACGTFLSCPEQIFDPQKFKALNELFKSAVKQLDECIEMLNGYEDHLEYPTILEAIVNWQEAVDANALRFLYLANNPPQDRINPFYFFTLDPAYA